MVSVLRPGQYHINIPSIGVTTSRRAVGGASNGLKNALIAYWKLDEASGDALDAHTNALTLTATATAPGADTGKVYSTARVSSYAATSYFRRSDETLLTTGDVDFTIAAWVYQTAKDNYNHIVSKATDSTPPYEQFLLRYQGNVDRYRFEVAWGSSSYVPVDANNHGSPGLNTWTLIVAWHDAGNNKLCISVNNGTVNEVSHSNGVSTVTSPLFFGRQHPASTLGWAGRFGPIAFWKSAAGGGGVLTTDQRTALYNAGAGLAYSAFS